MQRKYSKWFVARYTTAVFLLSLLVILAILFIQALFFNIPFSFSGIIEIHKKQPIAYFIDFLPFLLAIASFLISRHVSELKTEAETFSEEELTHQRKLYRFVEKLKEGDINADFSPAETDILGKAIVNLRNTLKRSKEEEVSRREEDERRRWSAEGLALFGEILRSQKENIEELSYSIISNLVKYIGANQGGFYLLDDSDPGDKFFNLTACYAYERRKYADKRVNWGEGLVGACGLEKQTSVLTKIPDSYLNITSGLGKANPRNLILVPLIVNDEIHGVIEVASFNVFDKYTVEFIEKVAESIASTISSAKINLRTAKLLKESREQAEALQAQEEQMRQNMEELQATQEEAAHQAEKFISFNNSVNHTLIRAEYDVNGILQYANTKFLHKLEYSSNSEVEGKHISMFVNKKDRVWFDEIWDSLAKGGHHFEGDMKHVTKNGKDLWTIATYTCVRNIHGGVDKVLFLGIDTTDQKNQSLDYEGQIEALNRSSIKVEFAPTGDIVDINDKFHQVFGYNLTESKSKTVFDLFHPNDRKTIESIWDDVTHGIPFEGQLKNIIRSGEERWFRGTYTAVNDMYGEVTKIVFIGHDITREKLMEIETKEQTERLKIQEEMLRKNEVELNRKLREAKEDIKNQFKEIEKVKIRNEKTLEGFLDAIITTDQDGIVQFFNHAAEELFGVDKADVLGQSIRILFPPDATDKDEFLAAYLDPQKEAITGERREITITKNDGEEVNVLMLLTEAKIGRETTLTAFIQNISVDLF
ncbi:MAG TPA: PAS domain S-box protein [Tenuifilaceae bacterium]|jgi:PAS domain S-box-containing protein|nr:PAS domain S-box protein [Bacteroidales bacterium]MDI9516762.1 PAS domain S-box protein [Bacteroidota bacterium]NLH56124.1 PAS domain S-box protein [Rikenellaceae bacterium]OQC62254.1 MAG: Biofilm dispersion protein BdlA [Bacteroidetes bacterium ADurb.Bin008]HNV82059.1 PAS domain S-box protein [Tenuifilaceae bacterium]